MKLLTQTGLYMVTLILILFFASGIAFYFVFKALITRSLDKELQQDRIEVIENFDSLMVWGDDRLLMFNKVEIQEAETVNGEVSFFDSILPSQNLDYEPVRFIKFYVNSDNKNYQVTIYESKISSDDLTVRITGLITLLTLFFIIGILLLNRYGFKSTWSSFWKSLEKVKSFKAGDPPPDFESTEIEEFDELNRELRKMTGRISHDYHKLESFTSHTTHEFQTPLAVIRSKLELLLQSDNLTEGQMKEIQNIDRYARHLSRLNQSLSLLFKIENQQFGDSEIINLKELLESHMDYLAEQAEFRGIKLNISFHGDARIMINRSLADILVLNLLRNALIHNIQKGVVSIDLHNDRLIVSNTGKPPDNDPARVFDEFVKGKTSAGLGLGLSIAKNISDQYGFSLNYEYNDQIHRFILSLNE